MKLQDKVAVVTGGANGIGKTTVGFMLEEGCRVVIGDLQENNPFQNHPNVEFVRTDVTKENDVRVLMNRAMEKWGRLDIMVASAGIGGTGYADEVELPEWEKMININLTGVFLSSKHAIPLMKKTGGGAIVNLASILGHVGQKQTASYSASKGGVQNLTRTLALDCAEHNIRVNAVCPGYIKTAMVLDGAVKDQIEELITLHPLGRLGEPEEVAKAIMFLVSEDASFITGTSLFVDGGYTAQ